MCVCVCVCVCVVCERERERERDRAGLCMGLYFVLGFLFQALQQTEYSFSIFVMNVCGSVLLTLLERVSDKLNEQVSK